MNKFARFLLVALLVAMLVPAFAFDSTNLSRAMDRAAHSGEMLNLLMHPGMPKPWTNPSYKTYTDMLHEAWKTISSEIGSLETKEEIAKARNVVELYKTLKGTYRDLGYQVEIALEDRIKFLEVHNS
ncbi:MAG: hypothetical protein CVV42_12765 [Candidatus Riflebacteria bacterium HGW-Riflebacteria-2]|jgi:nucleotide-binding universal stress UspA family protein|nr:MAG: hypothetical protein CVV42_12765 [Candidatus Riflebacteria bacterium HGW-Riflebacteria-2]